jgi:hypothetical protein
MVGTTYTVQPMPPDEASTDWFDAAPLRIGIEYRRVDPEALAETYGHDDAQMAEIDEHSPEGGFTDEGVSIHVVSVADDHEYLRFDVFVDEPHYHYVDRAAGTNTVVPFDTAAHGPMTPWMLDRLRHRLTDMLRAAGAQGAADALDATVADRIAGEVADRLRAIGEL